MGSEGSSGEINKNKNQTDRSLDGSSWAVADVFHVKKVR